MATTQVRVRPENGTPRAARAAYIVAVLKTFPSETLDSVLDTIGWPDDVQSQVREDTLALVDYLLSEDLS